MDARALLVSDEELGSSSADGGERISGAERKDTRSVGTVRARMRRVARCSLVNEVIVKTFFLFFVSEQWR